jgi:hypothetical protein
MIDTLIIVMIFAIGLACATPSEDPPKYNNPPVKAKQHKVENVKGKVKKS